MAFRAGHEPLCRPRLYDDFLCYFGDVYGNYWNASPKHSGCVARNRILGIQPYMVRGSCLQNHRDCHGNPARRTQCVCSQGNRTQHSTRRYIPRKHALYGVDDLRKNHEIGSLFSQGSMDRVRVGLLDAAGQPLAGFDVVDCDPIHTDSTQAIVAWDGRVDVGDHVGEAVRLKFELNDAKLYAFQFIHEPQNGATPTTWRRYR